MKSIKEKAEEYGMLNPDIHYNDDGNSYDNHDKPAEDFVAGANYVLDVIEEATNICFDEELKRVIKQLKGNK